MNKPELKRNFPADVELIEVGPRDGFQFETRVVPTPLKLEIIAGLVDAGLKHVQVTSFVHPQRVPQMADAEELLRLLPEREDITYSGLVLNSRGVERAHRAGMKYVEISISASDTHSRKNTGMSLAQAREQGAVMIRLARQYGLRVRAGIQCAFGCVYEGAVPVGRVVGMAQTILASGIEMLCLSDTTGMADPRSLKALLTEVLPAAGGTPVVLHLHDTRGLGLVNVMAALECGITHFDTALGGMGGCPFVDGAAGNIATEDTAYLMETLKVRTGVDIAGVAACSQRLEEFFGKRFAGKMHRLRG